jgi:hypothetical protein
MKRRGLLLLLLSGAVTAPRRLRAQQKAMLVIGFLNIDSLSSAEPFVAGFRQGLRARPEMNSTESISHQNSVIPAKAGTQGLQVFGRWPWAPAFAGATIPY